MRFCFILIIVLFLVGCSYYKVSSLNVRFFDSIIVIVGLND